MATLLRPFRVVWSWGDLLRRTLVKAFYYDNCLGMAAQLAYYFFFALFPALVVLIALASYFPVHTLVDEAVLIFGDFAPPVVLQIVTEQLRRVSEGQQGGLLTFGVLTALWTTSSAMTAISDTLNRAYHVEEGRPWWRVRLTAIALTIGVAIFILVSVALVLIGPSLAEFLADWGYVAGAFEWVWKTLQWPLVFILVSTAIALIYYFAPDVDQDWIWLTPGSVLATATWLLAALGFKYYVVSMDEYTESYGVLGAAMILMLWFYVSGLVILVGAELNAAIEHASPEGKAPGEKVAGEKRRLGASFRARWAAQRNAAGEGPPSADAVKSAMDAHGRRHAARPAD